MSSTKSKKKDATPKDEIDTSILARLTEEYQQRSATEEVSSDVALLFCGSKKSGKTSLIDRFINSQKDEKDQPRPTVALDYRFARYTSDTSNSKVLAHIYDLGAENDSNEELVAITVSPANVGNLVLAVTVDLSEPVRLVPALEKLLAVLRDKAARSLEALAKESPVAAAQAESLQRARREAAGFDQHPDKEQVRWFPVPLLIFGCKWDVLMADADPEKRKCLCKVLRYFAHVNGASLIFTSTKEKGSMKIMRDVLREHLFGVTAKGGLPEQLDPSKPLFIAAGRDQLESIGRPQQGSGDQGWRDFAAQLFPDAASSASTKGGKKSDGETLGEELTKFAESSVDGMVEQRTEELQQYRRQTERNQRLASEGVEGKVDLFR